MVWTVTRVKQVNAKDVICVEGLPGIGNVGKIAVDIIIDELKPVKVASFFSNSLPNSVFVNERGLVDLPAIEMYHKRIAKKDFFFLSGDVQPVDEEASYELTDALLDFLVSYSCREIVTLGGIGLSEVPSDPKVFCTGNNLGLVRSFREHGARTNVYGVVGPIIGLSGLLLGLGKRRRIPAAGLLCETYGHPLYIGLSGAHRLLQILNSKYGFRVPLADLETEMAQMLELDQKSGGTSKISKKLLKYKDINYIG
ncbi:MAG: PAC2 family protein [Nanoarchaeota archaeon]